MGLCRQKRTKWRRNSTGFKLLESVKESLCHKFKMKDLGELWWFLGTQFKCSGTSIEMTKVNTLTKFYPNFK